jgi:hypothetical protein|tara:strand:+ start:201 stop:458 length:258 start_codon:yes stop_codon:yes gene_type:complete
MAGIVVVKVGDLVCISYNDEATHYEKYTKNVVTREYLGLLLNDDGVYTNILNGEGDVYTHKSFDTIGGVKITSNSILFDELEKML